MRKGQNFRLRSETLGITSCDGREVSLPVPAHAIIEIVSEPDDERMIEVAWEGKRVFLFAVDVKERGLKC